MNNMDTATAMTNTVMKLIQLSGEDRLQRIASKMPNGEFFDLHDNKMRKCAAVVVLAKGDVCPILRDSYCCLNPLSYDKTERVVKLSTRSVAGTIHPKSSLVLTIREYNEDLLRGIERSGLNWYGSDAIIAYYSFDPRW